MCQRYKFLFVTLISVAYTLYKGRLFQREKIFQVNVIYMHPKINPNYVYQIVLCFQCIINTIVDFVGDFQII